jgi:hypothetical protein
MNTTVAKVIAFELGILIAILTWMALPTLRPKKAEAPRETEPAGDESFASVSPIYHAPPPRTAAVDYLAEEDPNVPAAAQPMQIVRADDPEIVSDSDDDYGYDYYPPPADPSTYIGTFPEPVLGPDYYPEYYGTPYFSYLSPQPSQIIIISPGRSGGGRHHLRGGHGHRQPHPAQRDHRPGMRQGRPQAARPGNQIAPRREGELPRLAPAPRRSTTSAQGSRTGRRSRVSWNR